jgi:hypothetical protein
MEQDKQLEMKSLIFDVELQVVSRTQWIRKRGPLAGDRKIGCEFLIRGLNTTEYHRLGGEDSGVREARSEGEYYEKPWMGILRFHRGSDSSARKDDEFGIAFFLPQKDFDYLWDALKGLNAPILQISCEIRLPSIYDDEQPWLEEEPAWDVENLEEAEMQFSMLDFRVESNDITRPKEK